MLQQYSLNSLIPNYKGQTFYHQAKDVQLIHQNGWDIAYRGGMSRFYGDGVYFSSPRPFWDNFTGNLIEAALDLSNYKSYKSIKSLEQVLQGIGINKHNNNHQSQITQYFLSQNIDVISFPEDVSANATLYALQNNSNYTFVAYNPKIIYVTNIS